MTVLFNGDPVDLLTYTSPSPKLCLQSDGVYKYQAHNLYLNSAAPANQSITVVFGATYAVTITGSVSVTASGAATGTWTAGTNTFTAATTTLTLGSTSGSGTVHVYRTPAVTTYLATTSSIRYALPLEWDSAGDALGLLVEESRTNLLLRSTEFTNAAWAGGAVAETSLEIAPNGSPAQKIRQSSGSSTFQSLLQEVAASSSTTYTRYFIVKQAEMSWIKIFQFDGVTNNGAYFDLANGVVGTIDAGVTAEIKPESNGFYRCAVTYTSNGSATAERAQIALTTANNGSFIYTGDGVSGVYVWIAQLETSSAASSPIETFGSTVTRAADNVSLATSEFPSSTSVGTLFVYVGTQPNREGIQHAVSLGDSGASERLAEIYNGSATEIVAYGGGGTVNINPVGTVGTSEYKAVFAYAANDAAVTVNGAAPVTDNTVTVGQSIDGLYIGSLGGPFNKLNGHIKKIMYVPRRMTNTELQTLTA